MEDVAGIEGKGVVDSNFSYDFNPFNASITTPTYTPTNQTKTSNGSVDFSAYTDDVKTGQTTTKKKKSALDYLSAGLDWLDSKIEDAAATVCELTTTAVAAAGSLLEVAVDTGANIVSDVVSVWDKETAQKISDWADKDMTSQWVDDLHNNTTYGQWMAENSWINPNSAFANGAKNVGKVLENVGATIAVAQQSVAAGVLGLGEKLLDGGAWLVSKAVGLVSPSAEKSMREFIARDLVGEGQKMFYENTAVGRRLNEKSALKYDSELAQGIRNVSEKAAEFAAATALTIVTGGAAAPFLVGTLVGLGAAAESTYQRNGTDTTTLQELGILGSGALTGLSWMANGKLGAGLFSIGKTMSLLGPQEVLLQMKNEVLNKEFITTMLKKGLASKQAIGNYISSGLMMADSFIPYIIGEKEFKLSDVPKLALRYAVNLGLNVLEDGARDYISDYKISDEAAQKLAARLMNPNDKLTCGKLNGLNAESLNSIYSKMTPEALVTKMFTEAEQMANTNYRAFFKNFREHAALHTGEVRDYAMKIATEAGLPPEKLAEVYFGAQYHDLGMKGGLYRTDKGIYRKISDVQPSEIKIDDINDYLKGEAGTDFDDIYHGDIDELIKGKFGIDNWSKTPDTTKLPQSVLDEAYSNVVANYARKNHPLNSAISILTTDVTPEGVDKNVVALLAMSHSKSTSGIKHFDDPDEWKKCVSSLQEALKVQDPDAVLDVEALNKLIDDPKSFAILQQEALCIRDGDAMSRLALTAAGDTIMQTGNHSHLDFLTERTGYDQPVGSKAEELKSFTDTIYDESGTRVADVTNSFSKATHAGEKNVDFVSTFNGSEYMAIARPIEANQVPNCTFSSIEERIGEVITYTNLEGPDKQFVIELPIAAIGENGEPTALGRWYEQALDEFKTSERSKTISSYLEGLMGKDAWKKLSKDEQKLKIAEIAGKYNAGEVLEGLDYSRLDFLQGNGISGSIRIEYR